GSAVQVVSNPLGGIAGLTLPDGSRRIYLYDDAGRLSFAGGSGVGAPMLYAYEAGAGGRLIAATGPEGAHYRYDADGSVTVSTAMHHFGTLAEAAPRSVVLSAGESDGSTLAIRTSELESASGRILLRVAIDGPAPAGLTLSGMEPESVERSGGTTVALFAVEASGLFGLELTGGAAGTYRIAISAAGDLNGDGAVNGTDLGAQDTAPTDINGDGVADAADRALLLQNFGLLPNSAPVLTPQAQKTYTDLAIDIPLAQMAEDAEGDPIFYEIIGAVGGTATLTADGRSIRFTPEAGRTDPGRVIIRASDGYRSSGAQTLAIDISGAALESIEFSTRTPYLADGQRIDFDITGSFADGGTAALPEGYVTVNFADPAVARLRTGQLEGLGDGFSLLTATRGAVTAATVVRSGKQSDYDEALITYGADVYPDAVVVTPGAERQLLLFDPFDENVIQTRGDEVLKYVVNGNIVEVTADGRIIGKAVGETIVQVIYRATELLVPVQVRAPVVGDAVPVGKEGGIVQNADGYQVAIAEGALPRDTQITIETLSEADVEAPPLPTGVGFEFASAFRLDTGDAPMRIPAQLAIPTDLPEGTMVAFYRITDFVTEDGLVKGYQQVETGRIGADGMARTTSPPFDGLRAAGEYVMATVDEALTRQVGYTADVRGKNATDAVQASSFVTSLGGVGGAVMGAMNAGGNMVLNLPRSVTGIITTVFNADTFEYIGEKVLQIIEGAADLVISIVGSAAADAIAGTAPVITSTTTLLTGQTAESAVVDPRLEIRGNRLAAPVGSTNALPTWVVFGNFDRDELQQAMLEAGEAEVDAVLRAKQSGGVAVRADYRVEGGEDVLTVRPPRDVAVSSVIVVRPDSAFQTYGFAPTPTQYATDSPTGDGYRDVTWEFSEAAQIRGRETDTFVAVERGIEQPEGAEVATIQGKLDQLVVIREVDDGHGRVLPGLVARIPVGYLDENGVTIEEKGSARPDKVVLTQDATRLYVGLAGAGGIAVVDAVMYRQIDVKPEDKDRTNFIEMPGARIGEIFLDRANNFLIATDTSKPVLYFIGINPDDPASYHKLVQTRTLDEDWPITGATLTPDFSQLIVTQADRSDPGGNGRAAIYDLAALMNPSAASARAVPLFEFGRRGAGNGTFMRNPQGVQTRIAIEDNQIKAIIMDGGRQDGATGSSGAYNGNLAILNRDTKSGKWTVEENVSFNFPLGADHDAGSDPFDIADPIDIVFSNDGKTAFVLGQRRFDERFIERNPNLSDNNPVRRYQNNPAGTNIAVIKNLLGTSRGLTPTVVAATRGIPSSWGSDIGLSSDGEYLYMSGGRVGNVLAYRIDEIVEMIENEDAQGHLYDHPVDDLDSDGDPITDNLRNYINIDIDARAAYGKFFFEGRGSYIGPIEGPNARNAPIVTGGITRAVAESRSIINLAPDGISGDLNVTGGTGSINLPRYAAEQNPQPTFHFELTDLDEVVEVVFTLAVAAPDKGLYVGDSTLPEIEALKKLGYVDSRLDGVPLTDTLKVEGNRNRIYTRTITREEVMADFADGKFQITLPPNTVLTRGQQYYWGVETVLQGSNNHPRTASLEASLVIEPATPAPGDAYAGVTVVTHGMSTPIIGPNVDETSMFNLALSIAKASDGAVLVYDPGIGSDGGRRLGNWITVRGDPHTASSIVLVTDWTDASSVNDTGFAEAAADAFYADIVDLDKSELNGLLTSPLHFIGQDRGAAVNSEIIQRLLALEGPDNLGEIHATTIDPGSVQPQMRVPLADFLGAVEDMGKLVAVGFFTYGLVQTFGTISSYGTLAPVTVPATVAAFRNAKAAANFASTVGDIKSAVTWLGFDVLDYTNFQDPKVVNWKGVGFADNYYQQAVDPKRAISFSWRGLPLDSADVNMNLTGLPGFFEDDAVPDTSFDLGFGIFNFATPQLGMGLGTVNARAVGWYLGTADLGAETYTGVGQAPDNIWRQASDRFIETKTAFPPPGDLWHFGTLARYYSDATAPKPADIVKSSEGFDTNLKSWYVSREFEQRRARTDAQSAVDNRAWEGVGTGWFYSSLGGGSELRGLINSSARGKYDPTKIQNATQTGQTEIIEDVFNGDFESTFRPFYGRVPVIGRSAYEIAGWSFHGGGISSEGRVNPQADGFEAATLMQAIPIPGVNSLTPHLDTDKLQAKFEAFAASSPTAVATDAFDKLKTLATFLLNEVFAFSEIAGAGDVATNEALNLLYEGKSKISDLPGLLSKLIVKTGLKLHDLTFGGGAMDILKEMALSDLANGRTLLSWPKQPPLSGFGAINLRDNSQAEAALTEWLTVEARERRSISVGSSIASFAGGELIKRIPALMKYIQENLLTYSFELQPGRSLVHNTLKFPEGKNLLGIDLTWLRPIVTPEPGFSRGNELNVYAEVDNVLYRLLPETPEDAIARDDGELREAKRVMFQMPPEVVGEVGRIVIVNGTASGAEINPFRAEIDNISFDGKVLVTDTDGDSEDLNILFDDKGQLVENGDGLASFLTSEETGTGTDRHELNITNNNDKPINITIRIPQNDFLTVGAVQGEWKRSDGQLLSDVPLDMRDGATSDTLTLRLLAGSEAILSLSASVDRARLQELLGIDGISLLTAQMGVDYDVEGAPQSYSQKANLFYMLDGGDASAIDGTLQIADTTSGQEREIVIPMRGVLADPAGFEASIINPQQDGWLSVDASTAGQLTLGFAPRGVLATPGIVQPVLEDSGIIRLFWQGNQIGEYEVEGRGTAPQTVNLDTAALRAALITQLEALLEQEAADEVPEEESFAALFDGLTAGRWAEIKAEIEKQVNALLAPAGATGFTVTQGADGDLTYEFTQGSDTGASLPVEPSDAEEGAAETSESLEEALEEQKARVDDPKTKFDKAADLLNGIFVADEAEQDQFSDLADDFGAAVSGAVSAAGDLQNKIAAEEAEFANIAAALEGDAGAFENLASGLTSLMSDLASSNLTLEPSMTEVLDNQVRLMAQAEAQVQTAEQTQLFNQMRAITDAMSASSRKLIESLSSSGLMGGTSFKARNDLSDTANSGLAQMMSSLTSGGGGGGIGGILSGLSRQLGGTQAGAEVANVFTGIVSESRGLFSSMGGMFGETKSIISGLVDALGGALDPTEVQKSQNTLSEMQTQMGRFLDTMQKVSVQSIGTLAATTLAKDPLEAVGARAMTLGTDVLNQADGLEAQAHAYESTHALMANGARDSAQGGEAPADAIENSLRGNFDAGAQQLTEIRTRGINLNVNTQKFLEAVSTLSSSAFGGGSSDDGGAGGSTDIGASLGGLLGNISGTLGNINGLVDGLLGNFTEISEIGSNQMSAAGGSVSGMGGLLNSVGSLLGSVGNSSLLSDVHSGGGSGGGGGGGIFSANFANLIAEALNAENSPSSKGAGGLLGGTGRLLDSLTGLLGEAESGERNPMNPLSVPITEMRETMTGMMGKMSGMLGDLSGFLGGDRLPSSFFDKLSETKADAATGQAWFVEAETVNSGLSGMLAGLFKDALGDGAASPMAKLGEKISGAFSLNSETLAKMGEMLNGIESDGNGILDLLARAETDPEKLKDLGRKVVDADTAWGRTEAELGLTEARLNSAKDAAEAAGVGADGALGALDGAITGALGEIGAQGALMGGALDDILTLAQRITELKAGDAAEAEALRSEFTDKIAAAKAEAEKTREKVDAAGPHRALLEHFQVVRVELTIAGNTPVLDRTVQRRADSKLPR
ncbi:MAG: hypothetical protein R3210_03590, partial [Roseovarius sp.]|nr:hypothetical protein [Roseovarius sp.]